MNDNEQQMPVALRPEQPQQMTMARMDAAARRQAVDDVVGRTLLVNEVMEKVMKEGVHYGKIPGCGDKPTLLKAGAEKLSMTFRLVPSFDVNERTYDNNHREYRVTCTLSDGTQGVGTCSTLEGKYRYRQQERKCPACGMHTIIAGKEEYGGGWLCFKKKGGCGEKFSYDDVKIQSQQVGRVEHDNPADYWNTCLKMGKKRAHVDAIITATGTSDILTQDVEEMADLLRKEEATVNTPEKKEPKEKKEKEPAQAAQQSKEPPAKKTNSLADVLKASKKKIMDAVEPLQAWVYSVRCGYLMNNETLDAVRADRLFGSVDVSKDLEFNKPKIKGDANMMLRDIALINPTPEETQQFADAHATSRKKKEIPKDTQVPRDAEADWKSIPIPAWSKHVKELGFKTFGDLPKNLLWWWACSWEPKGYQGKPPPEEEVKLRTVMDFIKGNYDFTKKEEDAPEPEKPAEAPPVEDDVPF